MYSALLLSASSSASTAALPFFHLGGIDLGPIPIQWFGVIVAVGVLIGASILRRYAEWHGVSDDQIRGLTGWVTVSGFLGAHWFDALFYEWPRLMEDPLLFFKLWDGISSYGGFLGGAIGFALYVWWKRLPPRLMADITIIGLLPAFSIGRIGCTVVSDHIGRMVDSTQWYAALAMNYPIERFPDTYKVEALRGTLDTGKTLGPITTLVRSHPAELKDATHVLAWNLGLLEFIYLVPVNLLILWFAFRPAKRMPAGFIVVMTGILYAPVRFFLDYLRPNATDPRYLGFTFAQWASLLAFGVAIYAASRIMKNGKPAEPITRTAGEAQDRLKIALKDSDDKDKTAKDAKDKDAKDKDAKDSKDAKDKDSKDAKDKDAKAKTDDKAAKRVDAEADKAAAKLDAKPASKVDPAKKPAPVATVKPADDDDDAANFDGVDDGTVFQKSVVEVVPPRVDKPVVAASDGEDKIIIADEEVAAVATAEPKKSPDEIATVRPGDKARQAAKSGDPKK